MQFDQRNTVYLGNLGAIPLFAHWSVLILLYNGYRWGVPSAYNPDTGAMDYPIILVAIMLLLAGIVLHELGHGIAARVLGAYGVKITLWAMGGLCSSVRDPRPVREIIILAAGPAVSFILAAIGWYGLHYLEHHHPGLVYQIIDRETGEGRITLLGHALWICFSMNLILGIFNSIPIYPLDGGQIVHNILLIFLRDRVANRVALVLAFVFAVVFLAWSYHRSGEIDPYTCILVGWLLFNANRYLA